MNKPYIVWFEEVDKSDVAIVGGKGANLGEMMQAKFPVPYGFIVTSSAYFFFLQENRLTEKINALLKNINVEDGKELDQVSAKIRGLMEESPIPSELLHKIVDYYE